MVLIVSMTGHASAFDCLAYKPERAVGQWHAEVISGKICWQGPNWRSFLPKSKARVEHSQLANSKPKLKVANSKPGTQVGKSEVENSKPDVQIESSNPDTQAIKIEAENNKPDVQIENSKPDTQVVKIENSKPDGQIDESKPEIATKAVDLNKVQVSSRGLPKPTSVEAAEFTNAASLEFNPEPTSLNHALPSEPQSITGLLVAFIVIALGTVGLVALILKGRIRQDILDADIEEQSPEDMLVDDELAPPLQPDADDEPEEAKQGLLTQSTY